MIQCCARSGGICSFFLYVRISNTFGWGWRWDGSLNLSKGINRALWCSLNHFMALKRKANTVVRSQSTPPDPCLNLYVAHWETIPGTVDNLISWLTVMATKFDARSTRMAYNVIQWVMWNFQRDSFFQITRGADRVAISPACSSLFGGLPSLQSIRT